MQTFTLTRSDQPINEDAAREDAAREHVVAHLRGRTSYDLVGEGPADEHTGVYAFITRVSALFAGTASRLHGHANPSENTWTVLDHEGQGDPFDGDTDWVLNAEWFDAEFPHLLDLLGVRIAVTSASGALIAQLPRRR